MPSYTPAEDKSGEGRNARRVYVEAGTRGTSNSHSYSFREARLCNSTRTHTLDHLEMKRLVSARASGILSLVSRMQKSTVGTTCFL